MNHSLPLALRKGSGPRATVSTTGTVSHWCPERAFWDRPARWRAQDIRRRHSAAGPWRPLHELARRARWPVPTACRCPFTRRHRPQMSTATDESGWTMVHCRGAAGDTRLGGYGRSESIPWRCVRLGYLRRGAPSPGESRPPSSVRRWQGRGDPAQGTLGAASVAHVHRRRKVRASRE
jgi:hypothetical protein